MRLKVELCQTFGTAAPPVPKFGTAAPKFGMQLMFIWVLEAFKGRAVPKFWHSCTSCTKIWHSCTSCSSCTCCSRCVCWICINIYYSSPYFTTAVLNLVQLHFLSYSCGTAHLSYSSCSRNYRILVQEKPWELLHESNMISPKVIDQIIFKINLRCVYVKS